MRRKRKVWWIAGGVGLVVLYMVAMLAVRGNPADAKMDATLRDISAQYGFVRHSVAVAVTYGPDDQTFEYQADGLTAVEADSIWRTIENVCQDRTDLISYGVPGGPAEHRLVTGDSYQSITRIRFRSDIPPGMAEGDRRVVRITVTRQPGPTFLERVKNLWPW